MHTGKGISTAGCCKKTGGIRRLSADLKKGMKRCYKKEIFFKILDNLKLSLSHGGLTSLRATTSAI